jgi:hypothetical protein
LRLERIRPGQTIRAEDLNKIIEAINRLNIVVGPGLQVHESAVGGVAIGLDSGPKKKVTVAAS